MNSFKIPSKTVRVAAFSAPPTPIQNRYAVLEMDEFPTPNLVDNVINHEILEVHCPPHALKFPKASAPTDTVRSWTEYGTYSICTCSPDDTRCSWHYSETSLFNANPYFNADEEELELYAAALRAGAQMVDLPDCMRSLLLHDRLDLLLDDDALPAYSYSRALEKDRKANTFTDDDWLKFYIELNHFEAEASESYLDNQWKRTIKHHSKVARAGLWCKRVVRNRPLGTYTLCERPLLCTLCQACTIHCNHSRSCPPERKDAKNLNTPKAPRNKRPKISPVFPTPRPKTNMPDLFIGPILSREPSVCDTCEHHPPCSFFRAPEVREYRCPNALHYYGSDKFDYSKIHEVDGTIPNPLASSPTGPSQSGRVWNGDVTPAMKYTSNPGGLLAYEKALEECRKIEALENNWRLEAEPFPPKPAANNWNEKHWKSMRRARGRAQIQVTHVHEFKFPWQKKKPSFNDPIVGDAVAPDPFPQPSILDSFLAPLNQLRPDVDWRSLLKSLSFGLIHMYNASFSKASILTVFLQLLMEMPIDSSLFTGLYTKIISIFPSTSDNSQSDAASYITPGLAALFTVLAGYGLGKMPGGRETDSMIMRFSKVSACITSASALLALFSIGIDYLRTVWFGYDKRSLDEHQQIEEWCDEVARLNTISFEADLRNNVQLCNQIDSLLLRGDNLLKIMDRLKLPLIGRSRFNAHYLWLQRCRNEAAHSGAGSHIPRVAASIFHFSGNTGVGKSEMIAKLNAKLLAAQGFTTLEDFHNLIYYRDASQERFDGYVSQVQGLVLDDFGMRKDSENNPSNEPVELIRMGNTAVWKLEMPNLSEKGNTFFRAKWVVLTSNRPNFNWPSLTNPEAVSRRIDLKFIQKPAPQYTIKAYQPKGEEYDTLNRMKVEAESKSDPDVYGKCWLFDQLSPQTDQVIAENLTFEQVAEMCRAHVSDQQKFGEKRLKHTAEYFLKCVADEKARAGPSQSTNPFDEDPEPQQLIINLKPEVSEKSLLHFWTGLEHMTHVNQIIHGHATLIDTQPFGNINDAPYRSWTHLLQRRCSMVKSSSRDAYSIAMTQALAYVSTMLSPRESFSLFNTDILSPLEQARKDFLTEKFSRFFDFFFTLYNGDINDIKHCGCVQDDIFLSQNFHFYLQKAAAKTKYNPIFWKRWTKAEVTFGAIAGLLSVAISLIFVKYIKPLFETKIRPKLPRFLQHVEPDTTEVLKQVSGLCESVNFRKDLDVLIQHHSESNETRTKGNSAHKVECQTSYGTWAVTCPEYGDPECPLVKQKSESFQDKTRGNARHKVESTGPAQLLTDLNAREVENRLKHNLYSIALNVDADRAAHLGCLLFIAGRVAITNRHIAESLKDSIYLASADLKNAYEIKVSSLNIQYPVAPHDMKDVAIIEFPRNVHLHSDIRKHFMTKDDFSRFQEVAEVTLLTYRFSGALRSHGSNQCRANDRIPFELQHNGQIIPIRDYFEYGIQTMEGDCGGPLIVYDKALERKIIGIHMAGNSDPIYHGTGVAIHQDFISHLTSRLTLRWPESLVDNSPPLGDMKTGRAQCFEGDYVYLGDAPTLFCPDKTNIFPSPVQGMFGEVKTKPAYLRPFRSESDGTVKDPLLMARAKAFTPSVEVDSLTLDRAAEAFKLKLLSNVDTSDARVLTRDESIAGIEGDPYYLGIKRQTSPGFGWTKKGLGKTPWLGCDDYVLDDPEMVKAFDQMINRIKNGTRSGTVWTDTLKDERRPIEKVNQGKTRLFAAGEMTYLIIFRMFFMGFAAHMTKNKIDLESCVGVNPYSQDWNKLGRTLMKLGPHIVAGDFSNYDGTLNAAILWKCLDMIECFYKCSDVWCADDAAIRRMLWLDIVHSVHITRHGSRSIFYMWTHSQPSGCPITALLNSLYHSIAARYVYVLCARKYAPDMLGLDNFERYVRHVNYGDDDVYNIHPDIATWYNQQTMSEMFSLIGMTYTDEVKSTNLVATRKLDDIQFLKRKFVYDNTQARFRCPLSLDTILEMAQWVRGRLNVNLLTSDTLCEAMYELSHHDKATFDSLSPLFLSAARTLPVAVPLLTYEEYQEVDWYKHCTGASQSSHPGSEIPSQKTAQSNILSEKTSGDEGRAHSPPNQARVTTPPMSLSTLSNAPPSSSENNQGTLFSEDTSLTETHEVLTFHEDGEVNTVSDRTLKDLSSRSLAKNAADTLANDVKGFLQRPVLMTGFDWLSTDAQVKELAVLDLPTDWLNINMIKEKTSGFRYLRCDLIVRVQVNAQPFNAGRLILVFLPINRQLVCSYPTVPNPNTRLSNQTTLMGLTGYPHVDLDLATSTSAELRIPFLGTLSHFDLIKKYGTFGDFKVIVYSPLTGTADVDGSVWVRAENISIELPTGMAQSGRTIEKKKPGNVETMSKTVGTIAKAASSVPIIGSFAQATSWVADATAGVASIFGWSKPADPEFTTTVQTEYGKHLANYNGDVKTKSFALDAKNETDIPVEVFQTDEDEMSFQYILSKPIYTDHFTMDITQNPGTKLWSWPVDPTSCLKANATFTSPADTAIVFFNNYLSYLSNAFRFWRGTLKYKFKIVKTPFHSGRIRVFVVPGAVDSDYATVDVNKNYSQVFDLRETNEFELDIPFKWNAPWKKLDAPYNTDAPTSLCYNTPIATIFVQVVNALRNPTTAANSINFLVEVSAGEDFQFAYPTIWNATTIMNSNSGLNVVPGRASGRAQSASMIPSDKVPPFDANAIAMGEAVTSCRQLLKRYWLPDQKFFSTTSEAGRYWPWSSTSVDYYRPDGAGSEIETLNAQLQKGVKLDMYDIFSQLYRFMSGSMRFAAASSGLDGETGNYSIVPYGSPNTFQTITTMQGRSLPYNFKIAGLEPFIEFHVPFYQPWSAIPTRTGLPRDQYGDDGGAVPNLPYHSLPSNLGTRFDYSGQNFSGTGSNQAYQSIGEDFSFGFLIGAPVTLIFTTTPPGPQSLATDLEVNHAE